MRTQVKIKDVAVQLRRLEREMELKVSSVDQYIDDLEDSFEPEAYQDISDHQLLKDYELFCREALLDAYESRRGH